MDRNLRIKANVGKDQVLHLNMKQNVDAFEMLSLTLYQEDAYKIHSSNYGVIVGRVLANDAFGVPNAKVSVFVPLNDLDSNDNALVSLYPYTSTRSTDLNGVRYNLLPTYSSDDCYTKVGTFPSKRLVLDDDTMLEIYDKYYKYSTVTNKAGDYMIFGVPTGTTQLHVDVDLSDIGILSQKPRDFVNKGYNINQFESPTKFKSGTALDNLTQIYSQDESVTVYPFWGDADETQAAVTRKDISLQYQFETTCVFLGSVITDTKNNDVTHDCDIEGDAGVQTQLTTGKGTIEMIRKTPYGHVEEYSIQGNELIDSNGVWCYQIPMNLDYVGMDEYGNIVPTNDPTKGIPTRTRVRFRITMDESGTDTLTRHKAKFLVPNNPFTVPDDDKSPILSEESEENYNNFYQYGTNTPDMCFRDLMWNCVYTVKSYIPRIQKNDDANTLNYTGIKGASSKDINKNPFPYNKIRLAMNINAIAIYRYIWDNKDKGHLWDIITHRSILENDNSLYEDILYSNNGISLDFDNDWVNGVLYFPLWFWRMRKKNKYKNGETIYDSQFCSNDKNYDGLRLASTCDLPYSVKYSTDDNDFGTSSLKLDISEHDAYIGPYSYIYGNPNKYWWGNYAGKPYAKIGKDNELFDKYSKYHKTLRSVNIRNGIVKRIVNKDGANIYYYCNSQKTKNGKLARLYSTDIVLLGSLSDNDMNGVPKISDVYPITTCNIPPFNNVSGNTQTNEYVSKSTGISWGFTYRPNDFTFSNGLFFGLIDRSDFFIYIMPYTLPKSFINLQRVCELGVSLDMDTTSENNNIENLQEDNFGKKDGLINKREIEDEYSRQLFATLNQRPLIVDKSNKNPITGYYNYHIRYMCPTDFDGTMSDFISDYTNGYSYDDESFDYEAFRFGGYDTYKFNIKDGDSYYFPEYNNSFYFYFGLNAGSTAIEKFKDDFYSECSSYVSPSFDLKIKISNYPDACRNNDGEIELTSKTILENGGKIDYELNDSEGNLISAGTINETTNTISGLSENKYELVASGYSYDNIESVYTFVEAISKEFNLNTLPLNATFSGANDSIIITSININGVTCTDLSCADNTTINTPNYTIQCKIVNSSNGNEPQVVMKNADGESVGPIYINGFNDGQYTITLTQMCEQLPSKNSYTHNFTIKKSDSDNG